MKLVCRKCRVPVVVTPRWAKYRMCETCLDLIAQEVAQGARLRWQPRMPILYWGDYRRLVAILGTPTMAARVMDLTASTAVMGLRRPASDRIPAWMLRKIYAPLRGKFGSRWAKVLPTRVFLARLSVHALRSQRKSSLGSSSPFSAPKLSRPRTSTGYSVGLRRSGKPPA